MYRKECNLRYCLMITRAMKRKIIKMESELLASMRRIETITACEAQRSDDQTREAVQTVVPTPVSKSRRGRPRKNVQRHELTRKRKPRKAAAEELVKPTRKSKRNKRVPDTYGAYLRKWNQWIPCLSRNLSCSYSIPTCRIIYSICFTHLSRNLLYSYSIPSCRIICSVCFTHLSRNLLWQ